MNPLAESLYTYSLPVHIEGTSETKQELPQNSDIHYFGEFAEFLFCTADDALLSRNCSDYSLPAIR